MNFALIPVTEAELNDRFFYEEDPDGTKHWTEDHLREYWDWFYDKGHTIHTIDRYDSYDEIDYILLYWLDWGWIRKLTNKGQNNKIIYCIAEPPTVVRWNCPEGYQKLKKIFPYILTWNRDWVDDVAIFKKPIHFNFNVGFGNIPMKDRKLITAITAFKRSDYPNELYSEREKAYRFFEENYPDDFDLYGWGWNKNDFSSYKGTVKDKKELFHKYRFALCLENTKNLTDYVTEKIYDCLSAGIVPIYAGAPNIDEYVPHSCFIDYFSFKSLEQLADYISNMSEDEFNTYLNAGKEFVNNLDLTPTRYYKIGESALMAIEHKRKIKVPFSSKIMVNLYGIKENLGKRIRNANG